MKKNKEKILEQNTSDYKYLHKDFHGGLCYAIKYLDDNFGHQATEDYLKQVARTFFVPLTQQLKKDGLIALETHWQKIFSEEQGKFSIKYDNQTLVLTVDECPAISHMKKHGYFYTDRFCLSTVVVNETMCSDAGYKCTCNYKPGQGKCVQKFWKNKEAK